MVLVQPAIPTANTNGRHAKQKIIFTRGDALDVHRAVQVDVGPGSDEMHTMNGIPYHIFPAQMLVYIEARCNEVAVGHNAVFNLHKVKPSTGGDMWYYVHCDFIG